MSPRNIKFTLGVNCEGPDVPVGILGEFRRHLGVHVIFSLVDASSSICSAAMNTSPGNTRKRGKSPDISPTLVHAASTSSFGEAGGLTSRRLRCLVEGDSAPFTLTVPLNVEVGDLKEIVHEKGQNGALSGVDAKDLVLLKVRNSYAETQHQC